MAKKKKKDFAVGDTVFAVDPHGKIVEATIKAIDPESMSPYELNLDTKFRYYTLDQLYQYREEAEVELVKEDSQRMLQAMKHDKKTSDGKIKVVLPVRIGHAEVFRDLPAEQLAEALCGRI